MGRFLGDTSHSVYLLHAFSLEPILAYLLTFDWFARASFNVRLAVCFFAIAIPLYGTAFLTYRYMELPGIG